MPSGSASRVWWPARVVLAAAVIVLGIVALGVVPAASQPGPAPFPPAPPVPGTNPAVQQWLKEREGLQVDLNNALLTVQQTNPAATEAIGNCQRLAEVTAALLRSRPAPEPRLRAPARAGLDQFVRASAACIGRDGPTTQRLLAEGLAARVVAQDEFDKILDGD